MNQNESQWDTLLKIKIESEENTMKIAIINGSARKGNTLAAIDAFMASEKSDHENISLF
nr:hypothetical protein [Blautia sp. MSJ-19]